MIREAALWLYHSLFDPGNIVASSIWAAGGVVLGHQTVWKRHIRPHLERTREIHRHLDPNDDFRIGDAQR